ncbi:hypothetical protein N7G274_010813 [Stereocaulon virgatum]|uniref:Rhodopsin domain-containing protein n=1 Tax=Stereocaulon virgatum TaxID=373712 RepID=A0ABR3ZTK8_9LECA
MSPTPQEVIAVAVILPCFGTIAVALRFYTRSIYRAGLKSDDWTILIALVITWVLSVILIIGASIGSFGGHTAIDPNTGADVVTSKEQNAAKLIFSAYLIMTLLFGTIKLSVLLFYRRIFLGRIFNRFGLCGIFSLGLFSTASAIVRLVEVVYNVYDTTTGYRDLIAVLTTVAVWSQVEAGIAVITACLPSIRPLFHRKSLESLVNSLRSAISLHSLTDSQHRPDRDNEPTHRDTAIILDKVGKGKSGNVYPTIDTEITGNCNSSDDVPAHTIYLQNGLGVKEERV